MSKTQHEVNQNIDPLKMAESLEPEQLNEKTLNDMRSGSEVLVEALLKENVDYLFVILVVPYYLYMTRFMMVKSNIF